VLFVLAYCEFYCLVKLESTPVAEYGMIIASLMLQRGQLPCASLLSGSVQCDFEADVVWTQRHFFGVSCWDVVDSLL
jgi:hypothetical protein